MEGQNENKELLKSKPLKEIYPDLGLRKKFMEQKLKGKVSNQIVVRCEPHPTNCKIPNAPFLILIAPAQYQLAYLSATIHTRISGGNPQQSKHSTYLFCSNKLVTAFRDKIGVFWSKNKQEDGILYLQYADTAPF